MQLGGAVALVSGGASGLGRAAAEALLAAGAQVVLLDLERSPGAEVASSLGDAVEFVPADVTDPDSVQAAVDAATARGPLRAAVSCAGLGTVMRVLEKDGSPGDLETFRRTVEVNLVGTFVLFSQAAAAMGRTEPVDGERGVLVGTASVAAFEGQVGQVAYSASKGGVAGMTLPVARDLSRALIRCATVAPGIFDTPMLAGLPEPARESLGQQVPHPARLGRPEEFGALVRHVVENPMINGEVIRLDGALRMAPR